MIDCANVERRHCIRIKKKKNWKKHTWKNSIQFLVYSNIGVTEGNYISRNILENILESLG